ncbi:MAG: hypothetical protein ACRD51_12305 [Candidatus Acidiferrum sp.]
MYCDGCGTPFSAGTAYCSSCGKQLNAGAGPVGQVAAGAAAAPLLPVRTAAEGRVRRNSNIVAGFWVAAGLLRLIEFGGLLMFRRMFFGSGWDWLGSGRWPFGGAIGFRPLLIGGLLAGGAMMALFAAAYLVFAWGLLERKPWARILGIVLAFLALLRIPFGTALGIYTLWVLLPESSGREYDEMAGVRAG